MTTILPNTYKLFNHWLNQWDRKESWHQCTFYSAAMNLYYNCWIKLEESDLDIIAKKQSEAGLFSYTAGWRWTDAFNAILKYVSENSRTRWWTIPKLITLLNDVDVRYYLWLDYMVTTWISVSAKWKQEILDGKIDVKDYKLLKWNDFKHYLNIIKDTQEKWFDISLVDNYFFNSKDRPNLYSAVQKELLEDITQNTKFLFKH